MERAAARRQRSSGRPRAASPSTRSSGWPRWSRPTFSLDDLVLEPARREAKLRELVAHVALQHVVLDDWGFRRRLPRGQGVVALLHRAVRARARRWPPRRWPPRCARTSTGSTSRRWSPSTSARPRRTSPRPSTRRERAQRGAVLRRGRRSVRQAHRGPRRARPLREPRGQLPAAAGRDVHRPGRSSPPTGQSALDEALPAPAALRRSASRRPIAALRRRSGSARSRPGAASASSTGTRWPPLELSGGSIQGAALAAAYLAASDGGVDHRRRTSRTRCCASIEKLGKAWAGHPAREGGRMKAAAAPVRVEVGATPQPGAAARRDRRAAGRADVPSAGPRTRSRRAWPPRCARRRRSRNGPAMALIKGMLASFDDPLLGIVPTLVPFQYNPTEVTRVFRIESPSGADTGAGATGSALNAARPAPEDYTVKLELDATDGLEKGGPLTTALGISPRLAAIEMLMQPVGSSLLGELAGALTGGVLGGGGATIPAGRLPLVFFIWGPAPDHAGPAHVADRHRDGVRRAAEPDPRHCRPRPDRAAHDRPGEGRHDRAGGRDVLPGRARGQGGARAAAAPGDGLTMAAPDPTSRYAGLPTISIVAVDGSAARAARSARGRPAAGARRLHRRGPAIASTCWPTSPPATPLAGGCSPTPIPHRDATRVEQPGQTIDLPDA